MIQHKIARITKREEEASCDACTRELRVGAVAHTARDSADPEWPVAVYCSAGCRIAGEFRRTSLPKVVGEVAR